MVLTVVLRNRTVDGQREVLFVIGIVETRNERIFLKGGTIRYFLTGNSQDFPTGKKRTVWATLPSNSRPEFLRQFDGSGSVADFAELPSKPRKLSNLAQKAGFFDEGCRRIRQLPTLPGLKTDGKIR
jgi:hypothetical protein